MAIEWAEHQRQQVEAFEAIRAVLGDGPVEIRTAGDLVRLMSRLPPDTEVFAAETVRVDERLRLGETPNRTAMLAELVPVGDAENLIDLVDNGEFLQAANITPAVRLGAFVIAANAVGAPVVSVPLQPYERAVEAFTEGDLGVVLDADVELLTWMANTLGSTRAPVVGELYDDFDHDERVAEDDRDRIPVDDAELRERLGVEAERLRQAAVRLAALRGRHAVTEAAAEIVDTAHLKPLPPPPVPE